eukprot:Rhum_TRINITY_DN5083_c0_g1::Rhum_TRINITY_DN5083_c0_g1_i1::g.16259::m.16259
MSTPFNGFPSSWNDFHFSMSIMPATSGRYCRIACRSSVLPCSDSERSLGDRLDMMWYTSFHDRSWLCDASSTCRCGRSNTPHSDTSRFRATLSDTSVGGSRFTLTRSSLPSSAGRVATRDAISLLERSREVRWERVATQATRRMPLFARFSDVTCARLASVSSMSSTFDTTRTLRSAGHSATLPTMSCSDRGGNSDVFTVSVRSVGARHAAVDVPMHSSRHASSDSDMMPSPSCSRGTTLPCVSNRSRTPSGALCTAVRRTPQNSRLRSELNPDRSTSACSAPEPCVTRSACVDRKHLNSSSSSLFSFTAGGSALNDDSTPRGASTRSSCRRRCRACCSPDSVTGSTRCPSANSCPFRAAYCARLRMIAASLTFDAAAPRAAVRARWMLPRLLLLGLPLLAGLVEDSRRPSPPCWYKSVYIVPEGGGWGAEGREGEGVGGEEERAATDGCGEGWGGGCWCWFF